MKISELKPGMRRVDVTGTVIAIEAPRDVMTKFGPAQVANARLQDESGSIKMSLWNEMISKVDSGAIVSIKNGYVDSFRGELQLSVGQYGRLTVQ